MDASYTNRLVSFKKSLDSFSKVRERDISDDFVLSGAIQKFNLTFDLAWKVMKDILVNEYGIIDFATGSPRETLKKARSCELIESDSWIDMMCDRNLLAHDYDGEIARDKVGIIINIYLPLFERLEVKINENCISS